MGASGWNYFIPWRADVATAFSELQQRVFKNKEYGDPIFKVPFTTDDILAHLPPAQLAAMKTMLETQKIALEEIRRQRAQLPEPQTIDDLREQVAEEGTHSILDIMGIGDEPDFAVAFPMPKPVMLRLYGTITPTHAQVEAKVLEAGDDLQRWQCWYLTVYEAGSPVEYYFEGVSGD